MDINSVVRDTVTACRFQCMCGSGPNAFPQFSYDQQTGYVSCDMCIVTGVLDPNAIMQQATVPINSKPTPPAGPSPTHNSQRSGPAGKPLPPGMGTAGAAPPPAAIPSAHGGKLIPVVRSHAAIAAAKRAPMVNSGDQLTDKSYVLVGQRAEDSSIKVIEHWPYLPTQTEVEAATKNLKYKYTRFALVNPQRTWDAP